MVVRLRDQDEYVCLNQIRTIDHRRLFSKLGQIDTDHFDKVKEGFWRLYRTADAHLSARPKIPKTGSSLRKFSQKIRDQFFSTAPHVMHDGPAAADDQF